jgi:hypothetical protein
MTLTDATADLTPELASSTADTLTTSALTAADTVVASQLTMLASVHQARLAQSTRSLAALEAQDTPDATAVAAAKATIAAQQTTVARIKLVATQGATAAPTVPAAGWAVWGHVYDPASAPLANYTVFLVDANKAYQSAYGFSYTDANGAFSIVYTEPAAQKDAANATPSLPTVFLAIANAKAEQVYLGSTALALTLSQALYVDTTLPVGEPALGDLPAEVRKTALPPGTTSAS